jgi:predicted ATP-grasp superfamily ATP-dependent carboligase
MSRTGAGSAPVLLLGAEETPALPILWSLSRRGIPVTVGSHRRVCTGLLSRFPARRLVYPDPSADPDGFLDWLGSTVRSGRFPVTLGCGEQVTFLLARHRSAIEAFTSVPVVELPIFMQCRDKSLTMKAASRCGVPTPVTWFPEEEGLEAVAARATYPAVVKPCVSDGARGISYVRDPDWLPGVYLETRARYGACIVQEFIPHGGLQYKAELLIDRSGRIRLAGTYAKLRYYPPSGGSSTLNRTVHRADLIERATRLLTHLRWYGMGDCDFIVDPRDGVPKLMEVNPRFTRTIRVLVEAGIDYPYELYRLALGLEPETDGAYREDVYLRYLPADLVWFLRSEERFRARPSFFRFFAKNLHYEEWSWRDPLTGFGFWASLLADMLDPSARRSRLR